MLLLTAEMAGIETLVSLISSCGFPIACCVWLFYYQRELTKQNNEVIDGLRKTVETNTAAITRMLKRLDKEVTTE